MNKGLYSWLRGHDSETVADHRYIMAKYRRDLYKNHNVAQVDSILLGFEKDEIPWWRELVKLGNQVYKGKAQEAFAYYCVNDIIHSGAKYAWPKGHRDFVNDYYSGSYGTFYKQAARKYEYSERRNPYYGQYALYNSSLGLPMGDGKRFDYNLLKDKAGIISFWQHGSELSAKLKPVMASLYDQFKNDTNVVFLSIGLAPNKSTWLQDVQQQKYTFKGAVQLYLDGSVKTEVTNNFIIDSFPSLSFLNKVGYIRPIPLYHSKEKKAGIVSFHSPSIIEPVNLMEPVNVSVGQLQELIHTELDAGNDGPYVFKQDSGIGTFLFEDNMLKKIDHQSPLYAHTDLHNQKFSIVLKKELMVQPAEFENPSKILAISDIEGNFDAFRKLLQSNKVIDYQCNWIFGSGHLVLNGDFFDRGTQVTEVLWLIYSLEEKAKAAGGYVHLILGNHELMNLSGDIRYVHKKYKSNAEKMGMPYTDLYGVKTELGNWLRTKNIIEKIGDVLFVHAGVSQALNDCPLSLSEMNDLARPYYAVDSLARKHNDKNLRLLYDYDLSPFWYRGYYKKDKKYFPASESQIDQTLNKFNVKHIVTGHSVVADTASTWFKNRIINIDTKHEYGRSEALLIENGNYYRVNDKGLKVLLFNEDKKKSN